MGITTWTLQRRKHWAFEWKCYKLRHSRWQHHCRYQRHGTTPGTPWNSVFCETWNLHMMVNTANKRCFTSPWSDCIAKNRFRTASFSKETATSWNIKTKRRQRTPNIPYRWISANSSPKMKMLAASPLPSCYYSEIKSRKMVEKKTLWRRFLF